MSGISASPNTTQAARKKFHYDGLNGDKLTFACNKFNRYIINPKTTIVENFVGMTNKGKQVAFMIQLPKNEKNDALAKKVKHQIKFEFGCNSCGRRSGILATLAGKQGKFFCMRTTDSNKPKKDVRQTMMERWQDLSRNCSWVLPHEIPRIYMNVMLPKVDEPPDVVVDEEKICGVDIYNPTDGTEEEIKNGWLHYHVTPTYMTDPEIDVYDLKLLNSAFVIYTPLLWQLFMKFDNNVDMANSLSVLYRVAKTSNYGSECLHAIEWIHQAIMKIKENQFAFINMKHAMELIGITIIGSAISNVHKEGGVKAFIGAYHTVNNSILNILEIVKSPEQAKRLLDNHFAPDNYKRCTGEAKQGNIETTLKLFDKTGIRTWIHTVDEIMSLGGVAVSGEEPVTRPIDGNRLLKDMLRRNKPKKRDYGGLGRSVPYSGGLGSSSLDYGMPSGIYKVVDLYNLVKQGKIWKMNVMSTDGNLEYAYTGGYVMDPKYFIHPHLWAFAGRNKKVESYKQFSVTHMHIVETGKYGCGFFIIPNENLHLNPKASPRNFLFPEFISNTWTRELRQVVEHLNRTLPIDFTESKKGVQMSFGIGVNQGADTNGKLVSPVRVIVNNLKTYTLTHFK